MYLYSYFPRFFNGFNGVMIYRMVYIYNSMCEKMWNGIFSFEFSFSRKSNLKIFRTRVNLIQCPYEWIIDKGLCYVKKKSRKKYFHFQSSPFEIEFLNLKIVRSSSRFQFFLRIKKKDTHF